ncbi:MAG TPA: hypothetical protein VFN38_10850, partial [Gemmatimonadaceae bacterium]|nr:hypothetical protein [Gemmatimonadaceae bacterium]
MTTHLKLLAAGAIVACPALLGAQAQPPALRRAHEIVALMNSAPPAAIRAYVDSAFNPWMRELPMGAHLNFLIGNRERSRGLEWVEVQEDSPALVVALLKRKLTGDH